MAPAAGWRAGLEVWLRPYLEALGHPARRAMCPLYVAGMIGPGERKSVQPMAGGSPCTASSPPGPGTPGRSRRRSRARRTGSSAGGTRSSS